MNSQISIFAALSLLLVACESFDYPIQQPITEQDLTLERILAAPGFTKDEIFESNKLWIVQNFKSAKAVVDYENRAEGRIIGKGIINYPCTGMDCLGKGNWNAHFTMQVDTKDQRFKLTFSNLRISWPPAVYGLNYQSGFEGPIRTKNDLETIKPALLKFGDEMLAFIRGQKTRKDW